MLANGIECVSFISQDADNFDHYWVVVDEDQCPWHEKFLTGDDDLWLSKTRIHLLNLTETAQHLLIAQTAITHITLQTHLMTAMKVLTHPTKRLQSKI